jgi:UDP-N-acetylmuramoyl-tripeptide--D-alanyl-D-alanine ligase
MGTNHPGEIALLGSLVEPTVGLITNIGRGHLEFFETIEGVAREKLDLFKCTRSAGLLIVNKDDNYLGAYSSSGHSFFTYSFQEKVTADVHGKFINLTDEGSGIWELNRKATITMQVTGRHNVQNALAASTVALYLGIGETEIKAALEKYHPYDKRMQLIRNGNWTIINDSYNANPDSFIPALASQQTRKIVLTICNWENSRHAEILGRYSAGLWHISLVNVPPAASNTEKHPVDLFLLIPSETQPFKFIELLSC